MPNRLHPAKWGPRTKAFDDHIRNLIAERGYGKAREYVGIVDQERAETVRRGMRSAGRHLGVSVKAFWTTCVGCEDGGEECRYHVNFTAYDPEAARAYKQKQAQSTNENN